MTLEISFPASDRCVKRSCKGTQTQRPEKDSTLLAGQLRPCPFYDLDFEDDFGNLTSQLAEPIAKRSQYEDGASHSIISIYKWQQRPRSEGSVYCEGCILARY